MTTEEAAERLFGKRVMREVRRELKDSEPTEKKEKISKKRRIEKKDT